MTVSSSLPTLDVRRRCSLLLACGVDAEFLSLDLKRLRKNRLIFPVSGRDDLATAESAIPCGLLSSHIPLPVDICAYQQRKCF